MQAMQAPFDRFHIFTFSDILFRQHPNVNPCPVKPAIEHSPGLRNPPIQSSPSQSRPHCPSSSSSRAHPPSDDHQSASSAFVVPAIHANSERTYRSQRATRRVPGPWHLGPIILDLLEGCEDLRTEEARRHHHPSRDSLVSSQWRTNSDPSRELLLPLLAGRLIRQRGPDDRVYRFVTKSARNRVPYRDSFITLFHAAHSLTAAMSAGVTCPSATWRQSVFFTFASRCSLVSTWPAIPARATECDPNTVVFVHE